MSAGVVRYWMVYRHRTPSTGAIEQAEHYREFETEAERDAAAKLSNISAHRTGSHDIPDDFEVRPCSPCHCTAVTCETCGLSWDDMRITGWTPAPGARCPFEGFHVTRDPFGVGPPSGHGVAELEGAR